MKQFPTDLNFTVEQVIDRLKSRRALNPRFKVEWTEEQITQFLTGSYIAEVQCRRHLYLQTTGLDAHLAEVAKWLHDNSKLGLMMCGFVGNGKTTMLRALKNLADYAEISDNHGGVVKMQIYDTNYITRLCRDNYQEFIKLCKTRFLGIDDLGREPVEIRDYGNVINPIVELIQYRYDEQLPTMITTNLEAGVIGERYGERVADRLREMVQVINFKESTFRV